jgi:hypothetical protein
MNHTPSSLEMKIAAQRELIPAMYGEVDFSDLPVRYTESLADKSSLPDWYGKQRAGLLANERNVAMIRAYTMLGDNVADAYAALMPKYGAKRLIGMLGEACACGLDHVPDAPPELIAFIREMERMPEWLDRKLIEDGARRLRNSTAHMAPFAIRGAFFATFMNKYSALPMALTGTLTHETAARRVKETATFFTTSVLPGALERHGEGFRAAAMVRLMHSMVRYNILARGRRWDVATYGIPIPQVDQMPAGLINVFLMARKVLNEGRTTFTYGERAVVELGRYRCFLLGLPEDLLSDSPQGIMDLLLTRAATLRRGFDDATCGALMRATMAADLTGGDHTLQGRLQARMEHGFAKLIFLRNFANNDRAEAARYGIELSYVDYLWAAVTAVLVTTQMTTYGLAARVPFVRDIADERLVQKLHKLLESWGHAEYTTRSEAYRPVQFAAAQ